MLVIVGKVLVTHGELYKDRTAWELWSAEIGIIEKKSLKNVDKMQSFCDSLTSNYGVRKDSVTVSRKIPQSFLQNMNVFEIIGAILTPWADYLNEV